MFNLTKNNQKMTEDQATCLKKENKRKRNQDKKEKL